MIDLRSAPFFLDTAAIDWVERTLTSMSEDEKIGQLFTLGATSADEALLERFAEVCPGGVMFRPMSAADVTRGVQWLARRSRIPLLIAANLEKGGDGIALEGTNVGPPMQVAATGKIELARALGEISGREGAALGVNWSFSPVVDVDFNFRNPITNTRTFGSDPTMVARMSAEAVRGLQGAGVAASVKHFPGDGVDERDQHLAMSSNDLSCEEWDATYGAIYRACIEAGTLTVMAAHIMQPAWSRRLRPGIADGDIMPASLSPELMNGLLREHLGFNGLIVTDATTMAGMEIALPRRRLVPAAIAAGADMFLFVRNLEEDVEAMRRGIDEGIVTPERLKAALTRILALKASLGLHRAVEDQAQDGLEAASLVGGPEHREKADLVADGSVTLVKDIHGTLPIDPVRHRRVLFHDLHAGKGFFDSADRGADRLFVELLEAEGFEVTRFVPPETWSADPPSTSEMTERYDLMIYLARLATKSNQTAVRIEWAQPMGSDVPIYVASVPTVFVSVENPYHLLDVPRVPVYINTYNSSDRTIRALVEKLLGRSPFLGASPVDPFCGRWDARL